MGVRNQVPATGRITGRNSNASVTKRPPAAPSRTKGSVSSAETPQSPRRRSRSGRFGIGETRSESVHRSSVVHHIRFDRQSRITLETGCLRRGQIDAVVPEPIGIGMVRNGAHDKACAFVPRAPSHAQGFDVHATDPFDGGHDNLSINRARRFASTSSKIPSRTGPTFARNASSDGNSRSRLLPLSKMSERRRIPWRGGWTRMPWVRLLGKRYRSDRGKRKVCSGMRDTPFSERRVVAPFFLTPAPFPGSSPPVPCPENTRPAPRADTLAPVGS